MFSTKLFDLTVDGADDWNARKILLDLKHDFFVSQFFFILSFEKARYQVHVESTKKNLVLNYYYSIERVHVMDLKRHGQTAWNSKAAHSKLCRASWKWNQRGKRRRPLPSGRPLDLKTGDRDIELSFWRARYSSIEVSRTVERRKRSGRQRQRERSVCARETLLIKGSWIASRVPEERDAWRMRIGIWGVADAQLHSEFVCAELSNEITRQPVARDVANNLLDPRNGATFCVRFARVGFHEPSCIDRTCSAYIAELKRQCRRRLMKQTTPNWSARSSFVSNAASRRTRFQYARQMSRTAASLQTFIHVRLDTFDAVRRRFIKVRCNLSWMGKLGDSWRIFFLYRSGRRRVCVPLSAVKALASPKNPPSALARSWVSGFLPARRPIDCHTARVLSACVLTLTGALLGPSRMEFVDR